MASIFTSTSLVITYLHLLPISAVDFVTKFTYVPQRLTWNDARDACHHMGGHLAEIHNETINNVILHFLDQYSVEQNIYIGLVSEDRDQMKYYWSETCQPMTWNNLSGEPPLKTACAKINGKSGEWHMGLCRYYRHYMCEHMTDMECSYEKFEDTVFSASDATMHNITTTTLSLERCFGLCDKTKIWNNMDCWALNFQEINRKCTIFFINDPYLATNTSHHIPTKDWSLYTKRCFNGAIGEPFNVISLPNESLKPNVTCETEPSLTSPSSISTPGISTELTSTITTESNPGPDQAHMSMRHTSVSNTLSSTLLVSMKSDTGTDTYTVTDTYTDTYTDTDSDTVTISGGDQTSLSPGLIDTSTETEYIENVTSASTTNHIDDCFCPCQAPTTVTVEEKQQMMAQLLSNLTVNKTELSSVRRKYVSAKDDRPLALGIGYIGAVFLGLTFGLMLLCDATTFIPRCTRCCV